METRLKTSGRSGGDDSGVPIQRSPADILRLVVAAVLVLILLVVEWLFGDTLVTFAADLLRGLDAVPQWIIDVIVIGTRVLGVIVLGGGLVWILYRPSMAAVGHRRDCRTAGRGDLRLAPRFGRDQSGPRCGRGGRESGAVDDGRLRVDGRHRRGSRDSHRRGSVGRPSGAPGGMGSDRRPRGHGVHTLAGLVRCDAGLGRRMALRGRRPRRRRGTVTATDHPSGDQWARRRRAAVQQLDRAGVDALGSTPYFGVGADGCKLFVKALGTDERSADQLFRAYRGLLPHNFGDDKPFNSLRRTRRARGVRRPDRVRLGVRTPALRAFATADPNGYVLAYAAIEGSPSTASTRARSPTPCSRRSGISSVNCGTIASPIATSAWRTSSSPTTVCLADRFRLQRGRRLRSAARHGRRRTAGVVERLRRAGTGGRQCCGHGRRSDTGPRPPPAPPVGAQRGDPDGAQGASRPPRRAPQPTDRSDRRHTP